MFLATLLAAVATVVAISLLTLSSEGFRGVIQLIHASGLGLAGKVQSGVHVLKVCIVQAVGMEVVREERRGEVGGVGATGERAVGRVALAVVVGVLVDATGGLGRGQPTDGETQGVHVQAAHPLQREADGIHVASAQMPRTNMDLRGTGRQERCSGRSRFTLDVTLRSFWTCDRERKKRRRLSQISCISSNNNFPTWHMAIQTNKHTYSVTLNTQKHKT